MQRRNVYALAGITAGALVLFAILLAAELGSSSPGGRVPLSGGAASRCPDARAGLGWYRRHHARWRWQAGARAHPRVVERRAFAPCPAVRQAAALERARARGARRHFERWFRETYARWRCIHEGEGSWTANTGNGYFGGLQMSDWFMHHYGPEFVARWGYAHRWPVWSQLLVAERARRVEGFEPWPTTGRRCGLI